MIMITKESFILLMEEMNKKSTYVMCIFTDDLWGA